MTNEESKPSGSKVQIDAKLEKAIARAKPAGAQPSIPQPTKAKSN